MQVLFVNALALMVVVCGKKISDVGREHVSRLYFVVYE